MVVDGMRERSARGRGVHLKKLPSAPRQALR